MIKGLKCGKSNDEKTFSAINKYAFKYFKKQTLSEIRGHSDKGMNIQSNFKKK